jgi:hypothetical protein
MAIEWCKKVDAVNIFPKPKLPVYLRIHYSKWQQNQRVRDAVAKAAPGEARLRVINAGFGIQSASTTEATMVPVLLPPTMPQPQGTFVQPLVGVIVEEQWLGEHHQLGVMTEINTCEERTELKDFVVGAVNIVYTMVEAWRRLVTIQGGGGFNVHMRRRWCITRTRVCDVQ